MTPLGAALRRKFKTPAEAVKALGLDASILEPNNKENVMAPRPKDGPPLSEARLRERAMKLAQDADLKALAHFLLSLESGEGAIPGAPGHEAKDASYQDIAGANHIADPNKIQVGQNLQMPGGGTHTVARGETLSGIAAGTGNAGYGGAAPAAPAAPAAKGWADPGQRDYTATNVGTSTSQIPLQSAADPAPLPPSRPAALGSAQGWKAPQEANAGATAMQARPNEGGAQTFLKAQEGTDAAEPDVGSQPPGQAPGDNPSGEAPAQAPNPKEAMGKACAGLPEQAVAFLQQRLGPDDFEQFKALCAEAAQQQPGPEGGAAPPGGGQPAPGEAEKHPENKEKPEMQTKPAMDAAIAEAVAKVQKTNLEIREAERAVRPYVGELAIACDSAEDVYKNALHALGIKTEGVHASAFKTILEMQPLPGSNKQARIAADGIVTAEGEFAKMFPDAKAPRRI